jgi:sortase A
VKARDPHRGHGLHGRLIRRAGSMLMIAGGLVLAYPFWSAAYTHVEQGQLKTSYAAVSRAFDGAVQRKDPTLATKAQAAQRLGELAQLFAAQLKPGQPIGRLLIPRLHFSRWIQQGAGGPAGLTPAGDAPFLRSGPVHYAVTPLPGAGEPFAIAGHRTTYGAPFYSLDKLRPGDPIVFQTPYARFTYRVARTTTVLPNTVSVLFDRGYSLVLTTCTPRYSASHRLVVWAQLTGYSLLR